ncbi:MAG: hypothetical protein E7575_03350 [Ruminococcaceae bacterium]|nr:hypothetical protein [Oscillospiraceae bacterium]
MKIGKILKYIFISILVIFIAIVMIRVFMNAERSTLSDIFPTESAKKAYASQGEKAFKTHKLVKDITQDGYFTAYALSYCESAKELQITVRYNDSLPEKYLKGTSRDEYYFKLCDEDGNLIATGNILKEKHRYFYNYLRLSFDGVEITDTTHLRLYLCVDSVGYPDEDTEGLLIHYPEQKFKKLSLSKDEKKSLKV